MQSDSPATAAGIRSKRGRPLSRDGSGPLIKGKRFDSAHSAHPMAQQAPETDLQNEGRLCIGSLPFVRLYRNNTGTLKDERGIPVSYGLAIGSADTIGLVAPHGRFLSIEWKRPGWTGPSGKRERERHEKQCNWRDQINAMGGVAGFASSILEGLFLVGVARIPGASLARIDNDDLGANVRQWAAEQAASFAERMAERGKRNRK